LKILNTSPSSKIATDAAAVRCTVLIENSLSTNDERGAIIFEPQEGKDDSFWESDDVAHQTRPRPEFRFLDLTFEVSGCS